MGRAELRAAVEKPATQVGLSFEKGLVTDILNDVGEGGGQLPLLEFALTELWKRRDKEKRSLRKESYEDLGRLQGAITKLADEVVSSLPDLEVVRKLFMRLVYVEDDVRDIRRRINIDELDKATQAVVDRLVEERLLVLGRDAKTGARTVEVIHEALLRNWGRLQNWLKEDRAFLLWRERLESECSVWIANQQGTDFLLRKGPLEDAERWYSERADEFQADERRYVEESILHRKSELEEERLEEARAREAQIKNATTSARNKTMLTAAMILIVVLLGAVYKNRSLNSQQRKDLDSRSIASEALQLKNRRRDIGLLLGLEAGHIDNTIEARSSLLDLIQASQRLRFFLPADERNVYSAVFDTTGRWVASGGVGKIYIWDVYDKAKKIDVLNQDNDAPINSLAFSPDGKFLVSGSEGESQIRRYSLLPKRQPLPPIPVPEGIMGAQNLVFSPDSKLLAYSVQRTIFIWSGEGSEPIELRGHEKFVSKLAFNPEGTRLASAGLDQKVFLWSIPEGKNLGEVPISSEPFNGIAFHPRNGDILAVAGTGIQLWDIKKRKSLGAPLRDSSLNDLVVTIAFSQDGKILASAGVDSRIRLWSFPPEENARPLGYLDGHGGNVWSLAFNHDHGLVSSGAAGEVIVWDLDLPPPLSRVLVKHSRRIRGLALDSRSNIMTVGGPQGGIGLWDAKTGESLGALEQRHGQQITCLAAAGNSRILASGDIGGKVFIWEDRKFLREVELPNHDPEHPDPIQSLALSADGRTGAVGTRSGRIFTWKGKGAVESLGETALPVTALAFDPVSGMLVSAGGTELILWSFLKGREPSSDKEAHDEKIASLVFRTDGLLASGSLDGTVRLWKIGETLMPQGAAIPVPLTSALAWSPTGKILAAGGADGTIALWDADEHRLIGSGLRSAPRVSCLAFLDDDHLISCGGELVLEWSLRYEDWRSYACGIANRSFSETEWSKYLEGRVYKKTCPGLPIDISAQAP